MRELSAETAAAGYGPTWRLGVLAEHLPVLARNGTPITTRPAVSGSGLTWAILPDGQAVPIVCGTIIEWVDAEDGTITGRCGADATTNGMCPNHAAIEAEWATQSDREIAAWERGGDLCGG